MGLEPIYLQHHCRSRCRKCSYERLHLVQWNSIDNVAVAAAAAAPCERTLNARLVDLPTFIPLLFDCLCQRFLICHLMLFALLCLWDYFHYPQIPRLLPDSSGQQQCKNTFYWAKPWRTWMEKIMKDTCMYVCVVGAVQHVWLSGICFDMSDSRQSKASWLIGQPSKYHFSGCYQLSAPCLCCSCHAYTIDFFLFLFRFLVEFIELDELYTVSM